MKYFNSNILHKHLLIEILIPNSKYFPDSNQNLNNHSLLLYLFKQLILSLHFFSINLYTIHYDSKNQQLYITILTVNHVCVLTLYYYLLYRDLIITLSISFFIFHLKLLHPHTLLPLSLIHI